MAAAAASLEDDAGGAARHAIVCLVMRGDAYVPGALVTAYSVRCAGTAAELVCMVTDDVSEAARTHLRAVFDRVVPVPYIRAPALPLATAKQRDRYGAWMSVACTKWNLLALDEYNKVQCGSRGGCARVS
jgi:hypothetical protein